MFLSADLDVDVLVVVFVQRSCGACVADPEVDGVGFLVECYTGEGDGGGNVGEEGGVFGVEVVVFCIDCERVAREGRRGWTHGFART